jgi:hypothetical protein
MPKAAHASVRSRSRAPAAFDTLESRTLLTGTVTGVVYLDYVWNNVRDPQDPPLVGWTVYADLNRNRVRDAGEPSGITDATGRYTLNNVPAGEQLIREAVVTGFRAVNPQDRVVSVPEGRTLDNVDFASRTLIEQSVEGPSSDEDAAANGGTVANSPTSSIALSGPNIVVVDNNSISVYRRRDMLKLSTQSLASLFAGQPDAATVTDPKVLFDRGGRRFVVVASAAGGSKILVALSRTANPVEPNTPWRFKTIDIGAVTGDATVRATGVSVTSDNVNLYLAANLVNAANVPVGSRLFAIARNRAYVAKDNPFVTLDPFGSAGVAGQVANVQLANTNFRYAGVELVGASATGDAFSVVRVLRAARTNPIFSTQQVTTADLPASTGTAAPAPQPAGGAPVNTGAASLSATHRNNFLWIASTVTPSTGADAGQATVYWYQVNIRDAARYTLTDFGSVGGEEIAAGTNVFAPSITTDRDNYMALSFSATGAGVPLGAYVTGKKTEDPAHTVRPALAVASGQGTYARTTAPATTVNWGASSIVVDPTDDNRFWVFNHYAQDPQGTAGRWGQRMLSFTLPPRIFPVVT